MTTAGGRSTSKGAVVTGPSDDAGFVTGANLFVEVAVTAGIGHPDGLARFDVPSP